MASRFPGKEEDEYGSYAIVTGGTRGIGEATKSLAMEGAKYGVTANAIAPGYTRRAPNREAVLLRVAAPASRSSSCRCALRTK